MTLNSDSNSSSINNKKDNKKVISSKVKEFVEMNEGAGSHDDIRLGLYHLIAVACKYQLSAEDREILINITNEDFPFDVKGFYESLREVFNYLRKEDFCRIEQDPEQKTLVNAAKSIFGGLTKRIDKKLRSKNTSRISDEVKKLYREDCFHTKDRQFILDYTAYDYVFREMFIRLRTNLSDKQYHQIPETLVLEIDSKDVLVRDLFTYNKRHNWYSLNKKLSKVNARKLQIKIAQYMIQCMNAPSGRRW